MEQSQNLISYDLHVDTETHLHLKETAMWAKFLGVIGFIFSGLVLLGALFAGTLIAALMKSSPYNIYRNTAAPGMEGLITFVYLVLAFIGFIISLFIFRFGSKTKTALLHNDQLSLNTGLKNLKYVFRFYGIIMAIYIGFIALALIVGIAAAIMQSR